MTLINYFILNEKIEIYFYLEFIMIIDFLKETKNIKKNW